MVIDKGEKYETIFYMPADCYSAVCESYMLFVMWRFRCHRNNIGGYKRGECDEQCHDDFIRVSGEFRWNNVVDFEK